MLNSINNFTPTVSPDNRFVFIDKDTTSEIVIGGSCTHVFEYPFTYYKYIKSGKVVYKQGLDVTLELDLPEPDETKSEVKTEYVTATTNAQAGVTIITVNLTPTQTQLFEKNTLNTGVQMRFITTGDEVIYDDPHKIVVLEPLNYEYSIGEL